MPIETRKGKKRTTYRAYWQNPITGKKERSAVFYDEFEAKRFDLAQAERIERDPESFRDTPSESSQSFLTIAMRYLQERGLSPSTWDSTHKNLTSEIFPSIGAIDCSKITKQHLKDLERAWREKGNKQITVNRKMSIIKAILSWATDEGYIPDHPVPRYICKRGPVEKIPPPSPAEVEKLYEAAPEHLKRAIILATGLGVRVGPSELTSIKWEDVDFEGGSVRVWSAQKNKEMPWRDVPLKKHVLEHLAFWKNQDGDEETFIIHEAIRRNVESSKETPIKSFKTAWATAKEKAGITRRCRPYDLRHYFATQSLGEGGDSKSVSEIMGHSTTRLTLDTYQHAMPKRRQEAVDLVKVPGENLGLDLGLSGPEKGVFRVPENPDIKKQ